MNHHDHHPPENRRFGMRKEDRELIKEAFKAAMKEYLEEAVRKFGVWSIKTLGGLLVGALVYFVLTANGWKAPQP